MGVIFIFFIIFVVLAMVSAVIVGIVLTVKMFSDNKAKTKSSVSSSSSQNYPPPIPSVGVAEDSSNEGIKRIRFDSTKSGIKTATREQDMLEASESAASDWLNKNPEFEIISITTSMGGMNASVTVWYKNTADQQVERIVKTPVESGNEQGTQAHR